MIEYSEMTDDMLVESCASGEELAWSELMKRYSSVLEACASEFYRADDSEIDDLISDGIFFGLISAVKHFDPQKASFPTFARRCIRNAMLNALERRNAKRRVPREALVSLEEEDSLSGQSDLQQRLENDEQLREVMSVVSEKLTEKEKQAFVLRVKGYTYAEIGQKLGSSTKSAESAVSRASAKLRDSFK